jgi:hypothetical protein
MDYRVEEIQPEMWRLTIDGTTRIISHHGDERTFAPWTVMSAEGRRLWSAPSLESALRWIQARTGQPVEALFAQTLLERATQQLQAEPAPEAEVPLAADPSLPEALCG